MYRQRSHRKAPTPRLEPRSEPLQRTSRLLPTTGCALVVDGHIKGEFKTRASVEKGAWELKRRYPMLQIKVYDAEAKRYEEIALVDA
jgi:hypothetical protein